MFISDKAKSCISKSLLKEKILLMSMEILQKQDKELQIIYNSVSLLELDLSIAKSIRQILIY